jgi:hypothetical protein
MPTRLTNSPTHLTLKVDKQEMVRAGVGPYKPRWSFNKRFLTNHLVFEDGAYYSAMRFRAMPPADSSMAGTSQAASSWEMGSSYDDLDYGLSSIDRARASRGSPGATAFRTSPLLYSHYD